MDVLFPAIGASGSDWRGLFCSGYDRSMADRVVVFIDYQNTYMGAREAFHRYGASPHDGQINPLRLGELIATQSPYSRELTEVRVYRGQPDAIKDPRGYAANDRQCSAWRQLAKTTVITRTLQYPREWPTEKAREKGIDVKLAIDLVAMAVYKKYDVAVLLSRDTDLKPALEFVRDLRGNPFPRCEVAAWSPSTGHGHRLSIAGQNIWCHWLSKDDYQRAADPHDYAHCP